MRNSAGHSDTVCSVFVRMGRAPTIKAVTSCSSACMSLHACGYTCASIATMSACSSRRMHLPIPHRSDIAAPMQHSPIYSRCMHSARQACNKIVPCGWWAACTRTGGNARRRDAACTRTGGRRSCCVNGMMHECRPRRNWFAIKTTECHYIVACSGSHCAAGARARRMAAMTTEVAESACGMQGFGGNLIQDVVELW